MFSDLAAYYGEYVVPSFAIYRDISKDGVAGSSRDLREALNAASALFHLREHLPIGTLSRAHAERLCPDYALLGDVVNAAKHRVVTNITPHGAPLVNDATHLTEQLVLIEYEDDAGTYRFVQKTVVVALSDGSKRNLMEVLTNVMNFWEQHMLSLGVVETARTFAYDAGIRARTRAECGTGQLGFEIVQGQRFRQNMLLLRYNYTTGKADPIDLTGATACMRIFTPKHDIELSLTHEASGKVFRTTITLTDDESVELFLMSSDIERQAYVNSLPATQTALRQLAVEADLASGKGRG